MELTRYLVCEVKKIEDNLILAPREPSKSSCLAKQKVLLSIIKVCSFLPCVGPWACCNDITVAGPLWHSTPLITAVGTKDCRHLCLYGVNTIWFYVFWIKPWGMLKALIILIQETGTPSLNTDHTLCLEPFDEIRFSFYVQMRQIYVPLQCHRCSEALKLTLRILTCTKSNQFCEE